MSSANILTPIISNHYNRLSRHNQVVDYSKITLEQKISQYLLLSVKLSNNTDITEYLVNQLNTNSKDILLIDDQELLKAFRDFKNDIYRGITQESFKSITERIISLSSQLESSYTSTDYKVYILGYQSLSFKYKLIPYLATHFPKCDLVLGIN